MELHMVIKMLFATLCGLSMIVGAVAILRKILDKYFGGI